MKPSAHSSHSTSLTILGCGTSTGVPLIHCSCSVCRSKNPRNQRLRASAWIQTGGKSFLIDTSTDLRQQAIRAGIRRIDAVLYTHPHADHIHGIDELRSYNFVQKQSIPIWGNRWTCTELRERFPYIFKPTPTEGGGVPLLTLNEFSTSAQALEVEGISIIPLSVSHGSKECVGYRINGVAYVTDCSYIPPQSLDRMRGLSTLVLDCLRLQPHGTHFNLDQALDVISEVRPRRTYLTHLGHDFDYTKTNRRLPPGVELAYDGLKIQARTTRSSS
jgi:phosphoribosyl 1,2-cyclic phosphate phosphodiesterase